MSDLIRRALVEQLLKLGTQFACGFKCLIRIQILLPRPIACTRDVARYWIDRFLLAAKALMKEGGVIDSEAPRHPLPAMHPDTRAGLIETARRLDPLVLRWSK